MMMMMMWRRRRMWIMMTLIALSWQGREAFLVFPNALDKELRVTNTCELISKPFLAAYFSHQLTL
jgi:hypothetical protein